MAAKPPPYCLILPTVPKELEEAEPTDNMNRAANTREKRGDAHGQACETANAYDPNADTFDDLRPIGPATDLDDTQPMRKPEDPQPPSNRNSSYDKAN